MISSSQRNTQISELPLQNYDEDILNSKIDNINVVLCKYIQHLLEQSDIVSLLLDKQSRNFETGNDEFRYQSNITIKCFHNKLKKEEEWKTVEADVDAHSIFQIEDKGSIVTPVMAGELNRELIENDSSPIFEPSTHEAQIIKKLNAVQRLRAVLYNDARVPSPVNRLREFQNELLHTDGQVGLLEHRSTSSVHAFFRDQYWKRVVTNCLAIITVLPGICLAIHSRFFTPKKSLNFMAFEGDVVMQNVKQEIESALVRRS